MSFQYDMREIIGSHLKKNGITFAHVSRKTGITADKLSAVFSMRRGMSSDEMIAICEAIGVDPMTLIKKAKPTDQAPTG